MISCITNKIDSINLNELKYLENNNKPQQIYAYFSIIYWICTITIKLTIIPIITIILNIKTNN